MSETINNVIRYLMIFSGEISVGLSNWCQRKKDAFNIIAWCIKGNVFKNLKIFHKAIDCYDVALKINPNMPLILNEKGFAFNNLGKHQKALACFDKALEIKPYYADAWYNKGLAFYKLDKFHEAIICYDKVLDINPKDAEVLNNIGSALVRLGITEK